MINIINISSYFFHNFKLSCILIYYDFNSSRREIFLPGKIIICDINK
jgi:hypothetical protein